MVLVLGSALPRMLTSVVLYCGYYYFIDPLELLLEPFPLYYLDLVHDYFTLLAIQN